MGQKGDKTIAQDTKVARATRRQSAARSSGARGTTVTVRSNKRRALSRRPPRPAGLRQLPTALAPPPRLLFSSIAVAPREFDNGIVVAWRIYAHPERGEVIARWARIVKAPSESSGRVPNRCKYICCPSLPISTYTGRSLWERGCSMMSWSTPAH